MSEASPVTEKGSDQVSLPLLRRGSDDSTSKFHFWVSSYPFFETSLFIVPPPRTQKSECSCTIKLYDPDGATVNEVTITFPSEEIYVVELEPLLGSCKLESGLKHAHAEVIVERGGFASCRVHTRDSAAIVGEPKVITPAMASFIPITLGAGRVNLILLLNRGEQEGVFRARLFFGKRSPEATWVIPPRGSRVVMVEAEFSSYISLEKGEQVQAYVRLSTKSGELGVQTLERTEGGKEEAFYASIS